MGRYGEELHQAPLDDRAPVTVSRRWLYRHPFLYSLRLWKAMNKQIHIISGGTFFPIRPHLDLAARAWGTVGWNIVDAVNSSKNFEGEVHLHLTKMAGDDYQANAVGKNGRVTNLAIADQHQPNLVTNADVEKLLDKLIADPAPKILFMPVALTDFEVVDIHSWRRDEVEGNVHKHEPPGKDLPRLKSADYHLQYGESGDYGEDQGEPCLNLVLVPAKKLITNIRKERKDIFLVGFKTTTFAPPQEMFDAGLKLLKTASCNLVLANDVKTHTNMIITPEQAPYGLTRNRDEAIKTLVDMALSRAQGHFTRSTVVDNSHPVPWSSDEIPANLKKVVEHCIKRGAYKPFMGKTVGHFAAKISDTGLFLTSLRGTDFNKIHESGLAKVMVIDDTRISALGGKPSVGGQSQRIIFRDHPEMDCIVHFHCPLKHNPKIPVPVRPQWLYECGSHECGQNTSDGLKAFTLLTPQDMGANRIKVVMLDKHGPNIVFSKDTNPDAVIQLIDDNFDLERSTSEVLL